jgi:hypothetical protein
MTPDQRVLHALVRLQRAAGSWALASVASVLSATLTPNLTGPVGLPPPPGAVLDDVWATGLCVAFLRTRLVRLRSEWALVERKAVVWLTAQPGTDLDDLLAAATGALTV